MHARGDEFLRPCDFSFPVGPMDCFPGKIECDDKSEAQEQSGWNNFLRWNVSTKFLFLEIPKLVMDGSMNSRLFE